MNKSFTLILILISISTFAQRQVVVMRKARIVDRYNVGDPIRYSTSTPKKFVRDRIVELTDTTIITRKDTILFYHIKLIEYKPTGLTVDKFGNDCIGAGIALFLGDLINVTVVQDQSYDFNRGVSIAAASMVATGIILRILGKDYMKIRMNNRLMIVDHTSPLYKKPFLSQSEF
ncbi:MAG TPA: hypothetical protein VGK59_04190 [Ohtaekwangia sp.]